MPLIRLDKMLADEGLATRSQLKSMIKSGRVTVDGRVETRPEAKLDPALSAVCLDGKELGHKKYHYYMLDKPTGVLTATRDSKQKTVLELLSPQLQRLGLFPVGRLDKDTSGLLLLTDDGDFAHRVISPKFGVEKLYYARVEGEPGEQDVLAFEKGLVLKDGTQCLPAKLEIVSPGECLVQVHEGKYHQVRRMLASRGLPVVELRRLSIGALRLDAELGPGGWRELDENDLCSVFSKNYNEI